MTPNVRKFVELVAQAHQLGPVVEFGSKQVPGHERIANLRQLFDGTEYTGCDLFEGPGVDRLLDWMDCATAFPAESVGTVIAMETVEHTQKPWQALEQTHTILKPEGLLIASSPFGFPIHHMPDYWRPTPEGWELLLDGFYRAVFFQGDLAVPHTIMAIAGKNEPKVRKVLNHLTKHIGELPGREAGEKVYLWTGENDYGRLRTQDREYEKEVRRRYEWRANDWDGSRERVMADKRT